jgi:hypothetical protein
MNWNSGLTLFVGVAESAGSCGSARLPALLGVIVNRRHLERVLRVFVDHHNSHRPHRLLNLAPLDPTPELRAVRPPTTGVERRDRLGGLVHEYSLAA